MGKIYVEVTSDNEEKLISRLKHVFGIVYIAPSYLVETDWDKIEEAVLKVVDESLKKNPEFKTFKVKTNRGDKKFPLNSMEISAKIGGMVLKNFRHQGWCSQPRLLCLLWFEKGYLYLCR